MKNFLLTSSFILAFGCMSFLSRITVIITCLVSGIYYNCIAQYEKPYVRILEYRNVTKSVVKSTQRFEMISIALEAKHYHPNK